MKKIIISSMAIILMAGAANAMPCKHTKHAPAPHHKPGVVALHAGPRPVARPAVAPRSTVVVVKNNHQKHNNCGCKCKSNKCHGAGNNNKLAAAMTVGMITGGVIYALAK
ncbi:MAG: hypothetical protein FWE52_00895 [Alphaproteobacteria bacterium]|nr:hypothetical protein [Alphaproteobacteria bacterium]